MFGRSDPGSWYAPQQPGGRPAPSPTADPYTGAPAPGAHNAFGPSAPDPGKGSAYPTPGFGQPPAGGGGGSGSGSEGVLSGPGYNEDFYKKYGDDLMGKPSASEDLYSQGVAGSNPFYDYAQDQTIKAINDQSSVRGNFNSSYTMKNIGTQVASLRGQQAHELGMLAGQADQGRFGRYDRAEGYSKDAQRSTEDRVKAAGNAYTDLANDQADKVHGFYDAAGKEMSQADMAAIEVQMKRAGMTAEEIAAVFKGVGEGAGDIVKAVA